MKIAFLFPLYWKKSHVVVDLFPVKFTNLSSLESSKLFDGVRINVHHIFFTSAIKIDLLRSSGISPLFYISSAALLTLSFPELSFKPVNLYYNLIYSYCFIPIHHGECWPTLRFFYCKIFHAFIYCIFSSVAMEMLSCTQSIALCLLRFSSPLDFIHHAEKHVLCRSILSFYECLRLFCSFLFLYWSIPVFIACTYL